jgi:hypothetical protein
VHNYALTAALLADRIGGHRRAAALRVLTGDNARSLIDEARGRPRLR